MQKPPPPGWPRISSALFYDDAPQAIDFLCRAFGFTVRLRVDRPDGGVQHSELELDGGLVMLSSTGDGARPRQSSPRARGGAVTPSLCVHVDDAAAHCARARAAGAAIAQEPTTNDHGPDYWTDRSYEAVDLEGHRWWFIERVRTGRG
jgi:uncharacterized glyoxalase superfamily protein PhnB